MDEQQRRDEQPTLHAGSAWPTGLDHAWVVESLDRQLSFDSDGSSLWLARARCTLCGLRATFQSGAVPPCHPGDRRPATGDRGEQD